MTTSSGLESSMHELELFSHWTFGSFAPGSIQRNKYNTFQQIHAGTTVCFDLLARIEDCTLAKRLVDWSKVCALTADLASRIRLLADQLQIMDPVRFMDVHDWVAKIGFYARLATAMNVVASTPPYFLSLHPPCFHKLWPSALTLRINDSEISGLVLTPSLFQYFIEANDLRDELDTVLRTLDPSKTVQFEQSISKLQEIILRGSLPEALESELEIIAHDIFSGQDSLELWAMIGSGAHMHCLGCIALDRINDLSQTWLQGAALKYCRQALLIRLSAGLADEEHELQMLVLPAGLATRKSTKDYTLGSKNLLQRLKSIETHVTSLHLGANIQTAHCRSLHDLVCLCLERGLAQIFSFAGQPALGMAAIKHLRLEIPVAFYVFNLGGGLFPTAVEKTVVGMEDVRSTPAWSLLMGLTSELLPWPENDSRFDPGTNMLINHSSYAVISQAYFYCTLRLDHNLFVIECDDGGAGDDGYISFWFKGGSGSATLRSVRLGVMKEVLKAEGFAIRARGDYLQAVRDRADEVLLQRNLVSLDLLIGWTQTQSATFEESSWQQGVQNFQNVLQQFRANPL